MSNSSRERHWTYTLFVNHPKLFLPMLESRKERTPAEIEGLSKIFHEFGLPKGSKVLDLMCGIGRHSISLAKKGFEVVGFDLSRFYLSKAKRWANREGLSHRKIRFYEGDSRESVRHLSENDETGFNAIINMYTSHGYYGEEEDLRLFKELHKISSSKCLLVIETVNRDNMIRTFEQFGLWDMTDTLEWHETRRLNLETSWLENTWKFYQKTPNKTLTLLLELPMTLRLYSLHEMKRLLTEAGWKFLKSYGNIQTLEPLTYNSRHMTLVSQKP